MGLTQVWTNVAGIIGMSCIHQVASRTPTYKVFYVRVYTKTHYETLIFWTNQDKNIQIFPIFVKATHWDGIN